MEGKCKIADCPAPISCHDGCEKIVDCPNWIPGVEVAKKNLKKEVSGNKTKDSEIHWSGAAFNSSEISVISVRSSPDIIGVVGKADAGKTTYLAMVYTLLLNGKKLKNFDFAGTKTIHGWDELHHRLKVKRGDVTFPAPTPVSSNRQYHLALRNAENLIKDLLFSDASGEVFTLWANDRSDVNAENARWIYSNANAFMLFIDCEALITQKNLAKREIINIAQQLTHDLRNRPVIAVWSKSDKKKDVHDIIKSSLSTELQGMFSNFREIEISNFLVPGPDELVHKNNLEAIDWLLERMNSNYGRKIVPVRNETDDPFLNYKADEKTITYNRQASFDKDYIHYAALHAAGCQEK